jgi:hypothetical protein
VAEIDVTTFQPALLACLREYFDPIQFWMILDKLNEIVLL